MTILRIDSISVDRIKKLHPSIRWDALMIILDCARKDIYIRITDGLRTYPEQNSLYAQGRTKPGNIVTNAKAGWSWHNHALAIDFCLLKPDMKGVSWNRTIDANKNNKPDWQEVVEIAKGYGFEWGGDWKTIKGDYPHLQKTFGLTIEDARSRFMNNNTFKDINNLSYITI